MGTEMEELPAAIIIDDDEPEKDETQERENNERRAKLLGELLIRDGHITQALLNDALQRQREDWALGKTCFLGQILIDMQAIQPGVLVNVLVKQTHLPYLHLPSLEIDREVLKILPPEFCRRHSLIPIDKLGRILTVAMVYPMDEEAQTAVQAACPDLRIKRMVCGWSDLQEVLRRHFSQSESVVFGLDEKP